VWRAARSSKFTRQKYSAVYFADDAGFDGFKRRRYVRSGKVQRDFLRRALVKSNPA
jgi:hypothetical protein